MAKKKQLSLFTPRKPKSKGERIRSLFKSHATLERNYGLAYRNIKSLLEYVRSMETSPLSDAINPISEPERAELEAEVAELRKTIVLTFKGSIKRAEVAINELVPNTFKEDEATQSIDKDSKEALMAAATFFKDVENWAALNEWDIAAEAARDAAEIGRASCRERV